MDEDASQKVNEQHPSSSAARVLAEMHLSLSWESVRHQVMSLTCLQLQHGASTRLRIEEEFSSEELFLDSQAVSHSIFVLNEMDSCSDTLKKAQNVLSDVLEDFSALVGWRTEQIGNQLSGYLYGENSLENIERLIRRILLGGYDELFELNNELDRVQSVTSCRLIAPQNGNREEVNRLKEKIMQTQVADLYLDKLVETHQQKNSLTQSTYAVCLIAATECGYRPTAEKYVLDIYHAIKPEVEKERLLMAPIISNSVRNAMMPIFVRHMDDAVDGLMTGDRWFRQVGAECRAAHCFPLYSSRCEERPIGRIIPYMRSGVVDFKADSCLSKFLRALFSGRDGGAYRTLHTHLVYSARTGCVPQGRVVSTIWDHACSSWTKRYGSNMVNNIERVVGPRDLAAIYAGGIGFVEFRNGFSERIFSGVFSNEFKLDTAGGMLSFIPAIGGNYQIVAEGDLDRRDSELLSTLVNAVESRRVKVDFKSITRVPFLYGSVNFVLDAKRTGVYDMWYKQRIRLTISSQQS
ncbi:hypothetical protein FGB62_345g010 [Gracilaria domingensis]|nr:hypothetical protein FGB62_345g010 [Gracilaria domingensis]